MPISDLTTEAWEVDSAEFPSGGPVESQARFLLRYAILAPSSHNSQPWEFTVDDSEIELHAAEDRWLEVADHDRRELYISVGCALENLCVAADHFDIGSELDYHDAAGPVATLTLNRDGRPESEHPVELFESITTRRTNQQRFEERPLADDVQEHLEDCVHDGTVRLQLVDSRDRKESIAKLQAEADRRQMEDPAYRRELARWIGNGALGDSWLTARIGQAVVTYLDIGTKEAKKNSKLVTSAPAVGVLMTDSDDPTARVRTGQTFERLALAATSVDVAVHPMSQILERPEMREELARLLGVDGELPQHLFRLGHPVAQQRHTPRWPLAVFLRD